MIKKYTKYKRREVMDYDSQESQRRGKIPDGELKKTSPLFSSSISDIQIPQHLRDRRMWQEYYRKLEVKQKIGEGELKQ